MEETLFYWIRWHFFDQPNHLKKIWKNLLKFGIDYFSVPLLLQTFFAPWRRYTWAYPRGLDIGKMFETFISNLSSRMIGMVMRFFLILFGILFEVLIFFGGLLFFLFWFLNPLIIIFLMLYGIYLIF
jgi:hypothetical protein